MKIISLIVAGLPAVVCFSAAVSFGEAAENAQSPKHVEKNGDFPKADLNGDGVVDAVDLDILRIAVGYAACDACPEDLNHDGLLNDQDLLLLRSAWTSLVGPLPAPPLPPNTVALTPMEQLGKFMVFDATLSNPPGQSCAACHTPETGFVGPSSRINALGCDTPGIIPGRVGDRKPYSYNYASYSPDGVTLGESVGVYTGGQFWDGRAADPAQQAQGPPVNPNEMNNTPIDSTVTHGFQYSSMLAEKLHSRPYTPLLKQVYGADALTANSPEQLFVLFSQAIAAFEASREINPFSSKFDASKHAVPAASQYTFTASEENGMALYFGRAQCFQCHSAVSSTELTASAKGKDVFTMFCFANIGTPKNMANPFYAMTDPSNPGSNKLGADFIDYGLGDFLYPKQGLPIGNIGAGSNGHGDFLEINGKFLTPTTRNVNKRPYPSFVKNYMHNGVFKSLKEVVHFYNTRNLTSVAGEIIDFTKADPYANLKGKPLWDKPEVLSAQTMSNPTGALPLAEGAEAPPNTKNYGEVGNLGLTSQEEDDVVNFMKTLTDGFTKPTATNTRIYASDHNTGKIIKIDEHGMLLWDFPNANGHDVQVLANGNVLITPGSVQEVTPTKEVMWEVGAPIIQHAEAAQRLPNGNTMIADNGNHTVVDVTPQKEVVWKYEVPGGADMRQVRRLPTGNTLICASSNHVVLEVNPAKEIVWKYELPFPYLAERLPNGNTLISSGEGNGKKGWYLIEVDSAGKTVWKYGGEGAPDDQQLRWPSGFVLVPDGRIFVSEAQGAKIRVISPDHKSMRVITSPALQHAATIAVVEE
ncbi:hypothetical protein LBMAG51_02420 [Phycisphaerae bacterium]|nr:hypothetical protein LBMAG51_02420 [Phycisphaerae bacterium]